MALVARRRGAETWREAVARRAGERGLAEQCLSAFDHQVATGRSHVEAAFETLRRWNCLSWVEGPDDAALIADHPSAGL